jgi:hypothetical protein
MSEIQAPDEAGSPRDKRQVLYNGRGQHTASIDPDGWLRKSVHGAKHGIRLPVPAWAFDTAHIEAAAKAGVKWIGIVDLDDGASYRIPLADFLRHARPLKFEGQGPQLAVAVGYWHCDCLPQPGEPVQLALL